MSDDSSEDVGRKTRACPKCRNVMKPITFEDITVDRCVSCGGLWFDVMGQRRLKDRPGSEAIDTAPDRPKGATPTHAAAKMKYAPLTRLKDVDRRDIEYEYCVVCNGAFFDGGEFRHYKDNSFLGSLRHMFRAK